MARPSRHRRRFLALSLACVAAFVVASTSIAATDAGPKAEKPAKQPTLDPLLERFPIGTERVQSTPSSATRATSRPARSEEAVPLANPAGDDAGRSLWIVLLACAGAFVLMAAAGGRVFQRQRARRLGTVSVSASSLALFNHTLAQTNERSSGVTEHGNDRDGPPPSAQQAGDDALRASDGQALSQGEYAAVGKRVIGILEAAEVAAAQIRAEAAEMATEIRKAAEAEAAVYLRKSEEEAAEVRARAEAGAGDIKAEAESAAGARRQEAEEEAQAIVAEAETRASATRRSAEEAAKQIEAVARAREEVLHDQVRPLEENLRRALEAFRGISGQLEELLADLPKAAEESLVETLNESASQVEARR
jgi:hypothetical protein